MVFAVPVMAGSARGQRSEHERTTLPAPVGDAVPPLPTPDEAVSALQHLRMHPGRESLEPSGAVRNRPTEPTQEKE